LFDHFLGAINARDLPRRGLFREQLNANAGSETNFQYSVAWLNIQQFYNARSDRSIGPGHYDATELPQDAFRPTERAHRQALQRTRPPAYRLLHPQRVCTTKTERRLHSRHAIPTSLIVAAAPGRRSSQHVEDVICRGDPWSLGREPRAAITEKAADDAIEFSHKLDMVRGAIMP
jgi:hypothetical protein